MVFVKNPTLSDFIFFGLGCLSWVPGVQKKYQKTAGGFIRARVGQYLFVQNALTAISTCFHADGGGVEGMGWGVMSATEDIYLDYAIKILLALRPCILDECKVRPETVLQLFIWVDGVPYCMSS